MGTRGSFSGGKSDRGMLTTHSHLVPRLRNAWSYNSTPPICLHAVVIS